MAEGIQVGDGVIKFLGDTTNLETAYQKIDQAPEHLKPASAAADQLGEDMLRMGREANSGTDMVVEGTNKVQYSAQAARAEVALLGEETGVKLPRHIRGFVAELPGVGKAMSAAFEATAVLILVQILVEAAEKLTAFISDTFIFTESMKQVEAAVIESNKKLLEYKNQIEELRKAYILIGKEGSEKFRLQIGFLNTDLETQKKLYKDLSKEIFFLIQNEELLTRQRIASEGFFRKHYDQVIEFFNGESKARASVREEITKLETQYSQLGGTIAVTTQKEKNLHKELTVQLHKEQEALDEKYDKAKKKLEELLAEQVKLKAEMLKLADVKPFNLQEEQIPIIVKQVEEMSKAYEFLGMNSIAMVTEHLMDERHAVLDIEKAYERHLATLHDVHVAKLKLVQDEIALAKAQGQSTKALQNEEAQLKKQIPELKQYGKVAHEVASAAGKAIEQSAFAFGQGAITITQALRQIAAAVIQSIASIAEKKGVEQLAEAFGHWPDFAAMSHHFAAAGLWFGLAGGVSAAGGAVGGSSAGPGTVANPISTQDNSSATQSQKQAVPITITGVQKFAQGGLISKPTMGIFAENPGSKELALPLDDPQAHDQIRKALGSDGPAVIVQVKGMISADNLGKVVKKMNKMVKTRKVQLSATTARRSNRVGGQ